MIRLITTYKERVLPALAEQLGRQNTHSIPRLVKVVVSMGLGRSITERKRMDEAVDQIGMITGQRPKVTRSRAAISGFRLRQGVEVGCCVTLRGLRMYEFLERLINLALPRVRDFRGLSPDGFDGRGNYSMGLSEQLVFPEINPDKTSFVQGMNIAFVTTANTDDEGRLLLAGLGIPFKRD